MRTRTRVFNVQTLDVNVKQQHVMARKTRGTRVPPTPPHTPHPTTSLRTPDTVERLFSQVGIAFSAKRKSSDPSTVADLMFAHANLP